MIEIVNYTCAECGALVDVQGIIQPTIIRSCEHEDAVVHANLKGTVYATGTLHQIFLRESELPAQRKEEFLASTWANHSTQNADGERVWTMETWNRFIFEWQHQQVIAECKRKLADNSEDEFLKTVMEEAKLALSQYE